MPETNRRSGSPWLGGEHRHPGRLAADLVAAAVDVGERLEHAVVDDPRDALRFVELLALEEHLLLLLETAAGEVDGQPDEPAEEEQQHDVVDRDGGGAHPDEVGDRDDRRGQEAARAPATTAPPATEPAAQIVGIVNCPAAIASGVSASIVASTSMTAIDTSMTTTWMLRRR